MREQTNTFKDTLSATQDIAKSSTESVKAGQRSATASEEGIKVAQASAYMEDRAYVLVSSGYLDKPIARGDYPIATVEMKNTGRTPAVKVKINAHRQFLTRSEMELAEKGIMPRAPRPPFESRGVIAPDGLVTMQSPEGL